MSNQVVESSSSSSSSSSGSASSEPSQKKRRERRPLDPAKLITDDYDSEEDYCPEGVTKMDRQVWGKYVKQIKESEGFDIIDFPGICLRTPIVPIDFHDSPVETETLTKLATLAIQDYNKSLPKTKYEFLKVETANASICAGFMYYITFQAKEKKRRPDHPVVETFQALVWAGIPASNIRVKFCRLKKMPDQKVASESHA